MTDLGLSDNIMNKVKRLTVALLCLAAAPCWGQSAGDESQADTAATDAEQTTGLQADDSRWDLQRCIDYALEQNLSIRRDRLSAQSTEEDLKTARAALFPSLSANVGQRLVNRPNSSTGTIVNGDDIVSSQSKTSYNGSYGIDLNWTLYNGGQRLNTIRQETLNNRIARLAVDESANSIEESIMQTYVQILYAAEAVKTNEGTLEVSRAEYERGRQLMEAGSLSKVDLAQLESQVSTDNYQLVTAQATLQDYKLQLKQLLELDGETEMDLYLPVPSDEAVLSPLPKQERRLPGSPGPAPRDRVGTAQPGGIGTGAEDSPLGLHTVTQPERGHRQQQRQRLGLHLRRTDKAELEQLGGASP